ncbi:MAG: hypothetical protein KC425_08305, partial [Anaerolineales bacterium]|nr:hypothetical protein [Anaerolineales bacterium]
MPSHDDLRALAAALGATFIRRRDLYAKQTADGAYLAVRRPLRPGLLERHLQGRLTLGAYVLDADSQARYLVLDADDEPDWRRLRALARVVEEMGCPSYLEASRRGGHLWLFFDRPRPGAEVRTFGQGILAHFGIDDVELFPKQDRLTTGPGSLIRLPFGVHQKSGKRYSFYMPRGEPLAATLRAQIRLLQAPETVPERAFAEFASVGAVVAPQRRETAVRRPWRAIADVGGDAPLSERLKAAVSVKQFVLRYVELSPSGKGLCPFHDDHNPSFLVRDE